MCRSSSSRRITGTRYARPGDTRWEPSTSWFPRSSRRSCGRRSRSSSTCTCLRNRRGDGPGERAALAAERSARAAAEEASRRSAFLARASVALSGSLSYEATTRELVRLAIPFLADAAALTMSVADGADARTMWRGRRTPAVSRRASNRRPRSSAAGGGRQSSASSPAGRASRSQALRRRRDSTRARRTRRARPRFQAARRSNLS